MEKQLFYKALVVDNKDPENARRVKVRVVGIHPMEGEEDYNLVPDEALPWAEPNIPITAGKNTGGFGDFDVPDKDDWVRVFFEDAAFQRPVYFGLIATRKDKNDQYKQGQNKVFHDRWNNHVEVNDKEIKVVKNNGHTIHIHDDFIEILTKDGNQIKLSDVDSTITVKDKNANLIETKPFEMVFTMPSGEFVKITPGNVSIGTPNTSDVAVLGNALLWWLGGHTHVGNLGQPTSPPVQTPALDQILKKEIVYRTNEPYGPLVEGGTAVTAETFAATIEELQQEEASLNERGEEETHNFASVREKTIKKDKEQETDTTDEKEVFIDPTQSIDQRFPLRDIKYVKFGPGSAAKLQTLDPKLQEVLLEALRYYDFYISDAMRTPEEQYTLFQKRPKVTNCDGYKIKSYHNWNPSVAVDLVPTKTGYTDIKAFSDLNAVIQWISRKKNIRIRWGGDWVKFKDYPHWELFNGKG